MKIKSSLELVSNALKEIKTITPKEALKLSINGTCNLIDIREKGELDKMGRIEESNHIPRGMLEFWLDPDSSYFKSGKLDMSKEMILFCAGGLRSALAVKALKEMGFKKASHIDGGFDAMIQNGFKINQS
ncbi:rhodanese-like domain-containing protein [Candidatus Pelagibacter sp.]|jgi:rhodanese-related sulfurtransferase|nr:rhodanese-like domain-containing protein [Candidatus Pelagibacter sp.]|tara:strand:- start:274 stop:663 length:390 start_codon:yes stop_codon:yes gene_type:complete